MDYQELVDDIRSFLAAGDYGVETRIADRSEEYAQACRGVNDRLRRCGDALRRGLRGDAMQLADAEPNLLELVAMLDFQGLDSWKAICAQSPELTTPPDLLIETAVTLNEAYAIAQPLQNLMARHRLLALARAPLADRLKVMRRLAEMDPESSFWDDDVRTFERARITEMHAQLKSAEAARDASVVLELNKEAEDSAWRISVPRDFRNRLQQSAARFAAEQTLAALRGLLPKLNEAYGALAYDDCKPLLAKWFATVASTHFDVPADLQEQVDPIVAWVLEEDQRRQNQVEFEEACNTLEQAIDTDRPTPMLEAAYQAVVRMHLDIPHELDTRYRQRLMARATSARHRRLLRYSGIAAGFLLVAGIFAWFAYQSILSREVDDARKVMASALVDVQAGAVEKGEKVRAQLVTDHPRILRNAGMAKVLTDFDNAVTAEKQRAGEFEKHMKAAVAAGVMSPDEEQLKAAVDLQKTPAEIAQVLEFKTKIISARRQSQQERDDQFAADGSALSADMAKQLTPALMESKPDEYLGNMNELSKRVNELRGRAGISDGLRQAQLASLSAVLEHGRQDLAAQGAQRAAMKNIQAFSSDAKAYALALNQYITSVPYDARATMFKRALEQQPANESVEAWAALVRGWSFKMMPATYDEAKARAVLVQQYLDQNGATPLRGAVQAYLDYLETGLQVAAADGPWKGTLRKLLDNPLVGKLNCLETTDGQVYYVMFKEDVTETDAFRRYQSFEAITQPDITRPALMSLTGIQFKSPIPTPSPQAVFAARAGKRLAAFDYDNWDTVGLDLLEDFLARPKFDVVLRAVILQYLLQLEQPVAVWSGQDKFAKSTKALEAEDIGNLQWLDPSVKLPPETAQKLITAIKDVDYLKIARTKIIARRDAVFQAATLSVTAEGILLKGADGFDVTVQPTAAGQSVWGIGTDKKLINIGSSTDKGWSLDPAKAASIPEGSLVFIVAGQKP